MISGVIQPLYDDLSSEEKRNLVLKLRYGQLSPRARPMARDSLFVVGQSLRQTSRNIEEDRNQDELSGDAQQSLNGRSRPFSAMDQLDSSSAYPGLGETSLSFPFFYQPNGQALDKSTPAHQIWCPYAGGQENAASSSRSREDRGTSGTSSDSSELSVTGDVDNVGNEEQAKTREKSAITSGSRGDFGRTSNKDQRQISEFGGEVGRDKRSLQGKSTKNASTSTSTDNGVTSISTKSRGGSVTVGGPTESLRRTTSGRNTRRALMGHATAAHSHKTRTSFGKTPTLSRSIPDNKKSKTINKSKTPVSTKRRIGLKEPTKNLITSCYSDDDDNERSVMKTFSDMPKSKPKNVCFDYPGVSLTHLDVKRAIENEIPNAFEANKVVSIRFENINVKYGTDDLPNRWHIELKDFATRNKLIKSGLHIHHTTDPLDTFNIAPTPAGKPIKRSMIEHVNLKLYDMVTMEEYKLFLRKTASADKLQHLILMSAGRGQNLLSNML